MSATVTRPDLAAAALEHHGHGWPVVPVGPNKAACATFKQWFRRPQTEAEVREFPWDRLYGLALLTWPASDLIVVDFDGPHATELWERTGIALPGTARTHTRSGGTHLIFRVPPGTPRPGGANGEGLRRRVRLVAADGCGCKRSCGVDLLLNGYFVAPPTRGYSEDPDHPLEPGDLAVIPGEVIALARRSERQAAKHTANTTGPDWFTTAMRGPVPQGARNDTAARLAGHFLVLERGNVERVLATLTPWALTVCLPQMDVRELRATIESVGRRERMKEPETDKRTLILTPLGDLLV